MIMDATETRFAHLLQPIRDLTKNWEVDVASQLGEYLDELDQICISFDGGETTMNFAEAALLIQGSACIYSKKVEYLYSLVYQALDMISNRKRDKQAPSIGQDGKDKDVVLGGKNDKVEFLLLDDIGEKNPPNIEMRNDSDDLQGLEVVRLTPEPLIPVEDGEKKKLPLYSHKGEVLASCRDFWMNNVTPHANGTIRLDLATTPSQFLRDMPARLQNSEGGPATGDVSDREAPLLPLNLSEIPEDAGSEGEAFLPLEDNGMELDQQTHTHVERHQAPSERRMLRERPAVEPEQVKQKEISDPWKCHNPFSSSEDKPLKIGKHFTIPQGLQEVSGNKRKRKGNSKLQDFMTWFNGTLSETLNRKPKKGPSFADMEDLYWSHMKERLKSLKSIHRKAGMLFSREDPEPVEVEPGEAEGEVEVFREHPAGGDCDLGQEGDDLSDHENYGIEAPAAALDEQELAMTASKIERFTYEDLVKKNVDLFLVNSQKYAQETELSRRVKDWEEKIDPHLDAQEERQAFDIHDYGNRMVEALGNVGGRRSFASIVRGMGNHEVCRYMLASLQLANDHTVEIHQQEGLEEAMDTMELTLLSKQRAHERFKIHIAPSLTESQ